MRRRTALLSLGLAAALVAFGLVNAGRIRTHLLNRKSLAALRDAATRSGADGLTRLVYARRLLAAGRADEAVPRFQELALEVPSAERQVGFAHALAAAGRGAEATATIEQARMIAPNDPELLLAAAWSDRRARRFDAARQAAEAYTSIRPDDPEGWRLRGAIANSRQEPAVAEPLLRKAIALDPTVPAAHLELAYTLSSLGRYRDAAAALRAALDLDPTDRRVERLWVDALALGARTPDEYATAIAKLKERIDADPADAKAVFALGQLELRINRFEDAREHLKRTVEANPGESEAWFLLAEAERRTGNPQESEKALDTFAMRNAAVDGVAIARKRLAARPDDAKRKLELDQALARLEGRPVLP